MNISVHAEADLTAVTHNDLANAVRFLAVDAIETSQSGHPGLPMGMADVATVLFSRFLKFDSAHPNWPDRDRFVLSAGHGSMLLYSLLYLTGNSEMTLDQIKQFRQVDSLTPGHPENFRTKGIETTTGPLGQGISTAVGMALAEKMLAAEFGKKIVDHHTYVLASDGDLMEGVSQEAIAVQPIRVSRVEFQEPREQHGCDVGHAHGQAGMAGLRGLDGVDREETDCVGEIAVCDCSDVGFGVDGDVHRILSLFTSDFACARSAA